MKFFELYCTYLLDGINIKEETGILNTGFVTSFESIVTVFSSLPVFFLLESTLITIFTLSSGATSQAETSTILYPQQLWTLFISKFSSYNVSNEKYFVLCSAFFYFAKIPWLMQRINRRS